MLVLTRKTGEAIVLNPGTSNEVVIRIGRGKNGHIRLAIDAPDEVKIVREELLEGKTDG